MADEQKCLVIVAEDVDQSRVLTRNFLEYEGYEVEDVRDPRDITRLPDSRFLIMDIDFPSGPYAGIDYVREQRSAAQLLDSTTIIFTTGFKDEAIINRLREVEPWELIEKPIEFTRLYQILRRETRP